MEQVLKSPCHPYTRALLEAMPRKGLERLAQIPGSPPSFADMPTGCSFRPRCKYAFEQCAIDPSLMGPGDGHTAACWLTKDTLVEVS